MNSPVAPSTTIYADATGFPTGLVGTLGVRIRRRSDQTDVVARATTSIVESPAGSGLYTATRTSPATAGDYEFFWDDGTIAPGHVASEDFTVGYTAASTSAGVNPVDMCTVGDVQNAYGTPTSDATLIQTIITAASRAINSKYNREFTPLTAGATRTFRTDTRVLDFGYADLRVATTVTLDPNGSPVVLVSGTDFKPLPIGASALGTYTQVGLSRSLSFSSTTTQNFGFAEVSILGDWGCFSTAGMPDELRRAAVETVGSWLDRAVKEYATTASLGDTDFATRPDRFAGWGIPTSAHRTLSEHERVTV